MICVHRLLAVAALVVAAHAMGQSRRAILVGHNLGRPDQPALRYTSDDVERMRATLSELGGFSDTAVQSLTNGSAEQVLAALDLAAAQPATHELFLFYFSGHGDATHLMLGETQLSLETLLERVRRVPAALHVIILDACQSGAALRHKGVIAEPPVDVRMDVGDTQGEIVVTSSSAFENAYESEQARAAIFTLHLTSGLRGAADEEGDGAVTLAEAYRYASSRTLGATVASSRGAQRPMFRYALQGQREPVLTTLRSSGQLQVSAHREGSIFVFDDTESRVLAELRLGPGEKKHIALPPGEYVVKQRSLDALRSARVRLGAAEKVVLNDIQMTGAPLVRLARKGSPGLWSLSLGAGALSSGLGQQGAFSSGLNLELASSAWLLTLGVHLLVGTQVHSELRTEELGLGPEASALWGVNAGLVTVRVGPVLGLLVVNQRPVGRREHWGSLFSVGARLRGEISLNRSLGLFVSLDGLAWAGRANGAWSDLAVPVGDWGVFGAAALRAGVRADF